tara:strand:- start:142 stop:1128 length:987 start_codon:yes stop_codon:yes gene_type:complete
MHGLVTGEDPRQRCGDLDLKLENPLGFFESKCLVEINDDLLLALGCRWDRPPLLRPSWDQPHFVEVLQTYRCKLDSYSLQHDWVDKDPRLCITYSAYLHILLRRIPLVVAFREPLAVATSLHARNGFSINRGLVLWWIYNHHIASQLCAKDLLIPYSAMLTLNEHSLQQLLGPFLELHKHPRPSSDRACGLISSLPKSEFNRAETALSPDTHARIHPLLLQNCEHAYKCIFHSSDPILSFQEHFNSLPRAVLECSSRDQFVPEAEVSILHSRFNDMHADYQNVCSSLERCEQDCASLKQSLNAILNSSSWKITAPLRKIIQFFRSFIA